MTDFRDIPSVDRILLLPETDELVSLYGRGITVQAVREALDRFRNAFIPGRKIPAVNDFVKQAAEMLDEWFIPSLRPVFNATGVILHTNLGRAPLSQAAIDAVAAVMGGYNTLEFNLSSGKRGSRLIHAEQILTRLMGAEAALVVNNNASAVLLALTALAKRKRVIISRTQLVEIGGGFRIPEVMKQSGAKLVEIGATNRVHLSDYEEALQEPAGLILRVHHSNYRIIGFTSEPALSQLAELAHSNGIWMMDDLGSGVLLDTTRYGLIKEPTVQESLMSGADLVCFSGDKLLGGPQAGILVGKKALIERIKKHPLARAVRADKMSLAALSATLTHYLREEAETEIPIWQMISASTEKLRERANAWQTALGCGAVEPSFSTIGGGSLPEETLPTYVLAIPSANPDELLARLRKLTRPVIARIDKDKVIFDPRTILPQIDKEFLNQLMTVDFERSDER